MEITTLIDTVLVTVKDTLAQSDIIDAYKELIQSQSESYNFLVYIFLGILGLFAFAAGYIYFKKSKDMIKESTREIFDEERLNIISSIKEEYEKKIKEFNHEQINKFKKIRADFSRLFANSIEAIDGESYSNKLWWCFDALDNYIDSGIGYFIKAVTDIITILITQLDSNGEIKKNYINDIKTSINHGLPYSYEHYIIITNKIPDILTKERTDIKEFFDSIKNEISEGKNEKEKKQFQNSEQKDSSSVSSKMPIPKMKKPGTDSQSSNPVKG